MIRRMMMAGLKNSGGGEPVLLQTIGIKFDTQTRTAITGYNRWLPASTYELLNSTGAASGITLLDNGSDTWESEDEGTQTDPDFIEEALKYMIYTNGTSSESLLRLTGLNSSRRYTLHFAAVQNYTDAGDSTSITVNGVTEALGGPNLANTVYKKIFTVDNPSGGIIDISFFPDPSVSAGFGCMNACIIKEYSI